MSKVGGNPNPRWTPGCASPNPSGKATPDRMAARTLAMACRDAVTDEELLEWYLAIASGWWPTIRPAPKGKQGKELAAALESPPSEGIRWKALEEFSKRRNGMPMQGVVVQADLEIRSRILDNAADIIDVQALDVTAARVLEQALAGALALTTTDDNGRTLEGDDDE